MEACEKKREFLRGGGFAFLFLSLLPRPLASNALPGMIMRTGNPWSGIRGSWFCLCATSTS